MPDTRKFKFLLWATVAVYLLLTALGIHFIERAEQARYESEVRGEAVTYLSVLRARLEESLTADLTVSRCVAGIVPILPELNRPRFETLAAGLLQQQHHIRTIGLAEGTVIRYVYPLAGNEAAVGLDYTTNEAQWPAVKQAIETRKTVVAGPVDLVQGGTGIIARTAFFAPENEDVLKGLVSVVIDCGRLLEDAGVNRPGPYNVAIRGKDGRGARGEVFHGDPALFGMDPVVLDVTLPEGSWQMACVPAGGWATPSPRRGTYRFAALMATALVVVFIVMQAQLLEARYRALKEVQTLSGMLPICAHCKKVRDDEGYWNQIENFVSARSEADFSHGVCPECMEEHYGDLDTGPVQRQLDDS